MRQHSLYLEERNGGAQRGKERKGGRGRSPHTPGKGSDGQLQDFAFRGQAEPRAINTQEDARASASAQRQPRTR